MIPLTKLLMTIYMREENEAAEDSLKKHLSSLIIANLNKRFQKVEEVDIVARATLLDPRYKNLYFQSTQKRDMALEGLRLEMEKLKEKRTAGAAVTGETTGSSLSERARQDNLWTAFDEAVLSQQQHTQSITQGVRGIDIQNYLALPDILSTSNPLLWWSSEGKERFPLLFKLAKKYLSLTATSVPSERVFSIAREVLNKKRTSLKSEDARMLVCLLSNLD